MKPSLVIRCVPSEELLRGLSRRGAVKMKLLCTGRLVGCDVAAAVRKA